MTSQITAVLAELHSIVRRWRRAPARPLATAAILALGIGAATAVFGVVNAALLRPLPYPSPNQLVLATSQFPAMHLDLGLSAPEAVELGRLTTAFTGVGLGYFDVVPVAGRDEPVIAAAGYVSRGLIELLGVPAWIGHTFDPADDTPSGPATALLGFDFWVRAFGGDRQIVGRVIAIDGRPVQIIGVMPAGFDLLNRHVEVWLPLQLDPLQPGNRSNHAFTTIARIRPGVSLEAARADVARVLVLWPDAVNEFHTPDAKFHPVRINDLTEVLRGHVRQTAVLVGASVLLLLLVASANAASLTVAHADRRARDLAMHAALGASPRRLIWSSAIEGLLLGALATCAGAGAAAALQRAIWTQAPASLTAMMPVLDWRVWLFGASVAVATGLTCGLAPVARLRATALSGTLGAEGRAATASTGRQRVRRVLVGLEIALALTLLSASLLMTESLWRLDRVDAGFSSSGVLKASITLPTGAYRERERVSRFYDALRARLESIPGVVRAAVMSGLPPDRPTNNSSFLPDGARATSGHTGLPPIQFLQFASPGFFETLGVRITQGRAFAPTDRHDSEPVAIVNEQTARAYWPDGHVVGRRIRSMGAGLPWMTVVGVAADMRQGGVREPAGTELFVPDSQSGNAYGEFMTRSMNVILRTSGSDPAMFIAPLRQAVAALDPTLAVSGAEPMAHVVERSVAGPRFLAVVLSVFGGIATLLSVAGVYGVVSQSVSTRRREFAIRRSLGAHFYGIARLVVGQTWPVIGVGLLAGGCVTWASSRWMLPFLFDVPAHSLVRLIGTSALLGLAAAAACIRPLLHAGRIDPAQALRND